MNGDYTLTLTESERSEVSLAADVLTKTPPQLTDADAWVSACRAISCGIPQKICEGLREFRHEVARAYRIVAVDRIVQEEREVVVERQAVARDVDGGVDLVDLRL